MMLVNTYFYIGEAQKKKKESSLYWYVQNANIPPPAQSTRDTSEDLLDMVKLSTGRDLILKKRKRKNWT